MYPEVDVSKCVSCHLCDKICPIDKDVSEKKNQKVYAFMNDDSEVIKRSSSGGFFPAIAEYVIKKKGVVFGCVFSDNLKAIHRSAKTLEELCYMQGSKYVQSYVGDTYIEAEQDLKSGKLVLYSGTPCQIDGLNFYLKQKYANLITVDIICHGVPNQIMLDNELRWFGYKNGGSVTKINFRDKSVNGWNLIGSISIGNKKHLLYPYNNPYYFFFDSGNSYRESCYTCKYANLNRISDFTIGDFWGIERSNITSPENLAKGVSLIIVNSEKAERILQLVRSNGLCIEQEMSSALRENNQLIHPVPMAKRDPTLIFLYHEARMEEVDLEFKRRLGNTKILKMIKTFVPVSLKFRLKRLRRNG